MKSLPLLTCLALLTASCDSAAPSPTEAQADRRDELRARAFATLTHVLETDTSTKQIHAAEVLIKHGRAPAVHDWFAQSSESVDDVPVRRVVVWRARAAAAPTAAEREQWVARILAIAATPDLPDRVHAIESIAKLGAVPSPAAVPVLQRWAETAPEREQVFIRWGLWPVDPPADPGEILAQWLGSNDEITRLRAAYITRWLGAPAPAADALTRLAHATTDSDAFAAIVLASAYLLSPAPSDAATWRAQLETIAQGDDPAATYHALQGLMPRYEQTDLERILPLLNAADASARIAAAWTILTVTQPEPGP